MIETVRKLLTLANDERTPTNEANAAARKVCKLIESHSLLDQLSSYALDPEVEDYVEEFVRPVSTQSAGQTWVRARALMDGDCSICRRPFRSNTAIGILVGGSTLAHWVCTLARRVKR